jgi:hypothetical protein
VDEERLELTLDEVQGDQDARNRLKLGWLAGDAAVDVWAEVVEQRVDEEWSEILDDEYSPPCDLYA